MSAKKAIHSSIKIALGYEANQPDRDVLKDWKERLGRVCKPCWELKHCPYGPLVEQSPLLPTEREEATEHHEYLQKALIRGLLGEVRAIDDDEKKEIRRTLCDDDILLRRALNSVTDEVKIENCLKSDNPLREFTGGSLPPIEEYRVQFEVRPRGKFDLASVPPSLRERVIKAADKDRARLHAALDTGLLDRTKPLDPVRRALFEERIREFDADDHPETTPTEFFSAACNVFGHICPVFFAAESITETAETRRRGRYIPFKVKIRVVRRDNYTCQHCGTHLGDDEVEFDHIIPISKGGSSEEHNIRLTCFGCNRDKSNHVTI